MVEMASNHCGGTGPSQSLSWGEDCSPYRASVGTLYKTKSSSNQIVIPTLKTLDPTSQLSWLLCLPHCCDPVGCQPQRGKALGHSGVRFVCLGHQECLLRKGPSLERPCSHCLQVQGSDPELSQGSWYLISYLFTFWDLRALLSAGSHDFSTVPSPQGPHFPGLPF